MAQNNSIKRIWGSSFELMVKRPIVILPFFIMAFIEGLALELIYFSNRAPLSLLASPIIRKFSGEIFLHYPFNIAKIPRYFYYTQLLTFVLVGILLSAITVNIVKNIKEGLPLRVKALIKNAVKRYFAFSMLGILMIALMFGLRTADTFLYVKLAGLVSKNLQATHPQLFGAGMSGFYFITSLMMHTLFILVVPIMVVRKCSFVRSLFSSIGLGLRHFFSLILVIFLPYALYFPVTLLKAYSPEFGSKIFPEVTILILASGIIIAAFVDCFVVVCATQFLMDRAKK